MSANVSVLSHPLVSFEHGTINVASADMLAIPDVKYDDRSKTLRAYGMYYANIIQYLEESEILYNDTAPNYPPMHILSSDITLRDYQQDSIARWKKASMRGCVVLPTGAGKTAVGVSAICEANVPALVIVPTIDLLQQWVDFLHTHLRVNQDVVVVDDDAIKDNAHHNVSDTHTLQIGKIGGGFDDICAVTVTTYDSAYIRAPEIGNQFGLLVFDEVHHLPAPGYKLIAEQCIAPFRLGLTATLEREDGLHKIIPKLVGGVVYRKGAHELAEKKHLAEYDLQKIRVQLSNTEQAEYKKYRSEFLAGLNKLGMKTESMYNLKRLILLSNRNKNARAALLARNKANEIAFNTSAKIIELRKILQENCQSLAGCDSSNNVADDNNIHNIAAEGNDAIYETQNPLINTSKDTRTRRIRKKTIIFTQNNKMAYFISDTFLIPIITHKTAKPERKEILDGFRAGKYIAVVTSRVLDEGVDVPDAELGIIVSGTGSGRAMIQRLGRLLRPKKDNSRSLLVEMISDATRETGSSARRLTALNRNAKHNPKYKSDNKADKHPDKIQKSHTSSNFTKE